MNSASKRLSIVLLSALALSACTGSQTSSSNTSSQGTEATEAPSGGAITTAMHTALPANTKTAVTFTVSDVAVSSSGANTLRLGFTINNASNNPVLCDASEFNVQTDDGQVVPADGSAENTCDPETVDPHGSGKATMFFDLPAGYTGGLTLFLVINDNVIGQGTTSVK